MFRLGRGTDNVVFLVLPVPMGARETKHSTKVVVVIEPIVWAKGDIAKS